MFNPTAYFLSRRRGEHYAQFLKPINTKLQFPPKSVVSVDATTSAAGHPAEFSDEALACVTLRHLAAKQQEVTIGREYRANLLQQALVC